MLKQPADDRQQKVLGELKSYHPYLRFDVPVHNSGWTVM